MAEPPRRHPHPDPTDEAGPWATLVVAAAAGWVALVLVDRRVLADGTLLWATVRSLHTLILAPLAAAALVGDGRAARAAGVRFGHLRWAYGLGTLLFPPTGWIYLVHRRLRENAA